MIVVDPVIHSPSKPNQTKQTQARVKSKGDETRRDEKRKEAG
jgi:hypothetical protein